LPKSNQFYPRKSLLGNVAVSPAPSPTALIEAIQINKAYKMRLFVNEMLLGAKDVRTKSRKIDLSSPNVRKNVRIGSTFLSVRTYHKFRNIRSFCIKNCGHPNMKNPPCPQNVALDNPP